MNQTHIERFEAWLSNLPPQLKIRYYDVKDCVLAQFIKDQTGAIEVQVGYSSFIYYRRDGKLMAGTIPDEIRTALHRAHVDGWVTVQDLINQLGEERRINNVLEEILR